MSQEPLRTLFRARAELYASKTKPPFTHVPTPPPSPTPEPRGPSPASIVAQTPEATEIRSLTPEEAPTEQIASPYTPPRPTLHFDYGGYGGFHYSPAGHIVADSSPEVLVSDSDSEDGELQYPPIVYDVCKPVALYIWFDVRSSLRFIIRRLTT